MGLREQRVPAVSKSISRARFQRAVMLLNLSQHPLVRFFLVCKGLETLLCPRWLLLCPGSARVAWSRVLVACSVGAAADGEQGVTSVIPAAPGACRRAASPSLISRNPFPAQVHPAWPGTGHSLRAPRGRRTLCRAGQAASSSCCPPPPPHGQLYLRLPVPGAQLRCKRRRVHWFVHFWLT